MDTSKEYTLQCEKAYQIQRYWRKLPDDDDRLGDYVIRYSDADGDVSVVDYSLSSFEYCLKDEPKAIWLLRQDQLQDMVINHWKESDCINSHIVYLDELYQFAFKNEIELAAQSKSSEQLKLMFLMKEKYNKKWTGKKWKNDV